jgi:WD40 repeat protein
MIQAKLTLSLKFADYANGVVWSPNNLYVLISFANGFVVIVDTITKKVVQNFQAHERGCLKAIWLNDSETFVTAGQDGKLRMWKLSYEKAICELIGDDGKSLAWVENLVYNPVLNVFASSAGKNLKIWDSKGNLLNHFTDFKSTIYDIQFSEDGRQIIVVYYAGVSIFDVQSGELSQFLGYQMSLISVAWSPNNRYIACGTQDKRIHFWILPYQPQSDLEMSGYYSKIRTMSWHSTSKFLITASYNGLIIWRTDNKEQSPRGTKPVILEAHESKVTKVAFQKEGIFLATADESGLLFIWDFPYSEDIVIDHKIGAEITDLAWANQKDTKLMVVSATGQVQLIEIEMDNKIKKRITQFIYQ